MSLLFNALGISGKLLLAQAVNFAIVLVVLTFVLFRPLLRLIDERKKKIELGLHSAEIAEVRLRDIEQERIEKLAEAGRGALKIIADAEKSGAERQSKIIESAELKAEDTLKNSLQIAERRKQEELDRLARESGKLMRDSIMKAVETDPEHIDEKFVQRAANIMKKKIAAL